MIRAGVYENPGVDADVVTVDPAGSYPRFALDINLGYYKYTSSTTDRERHHLKLTAKALREWDIDMLITLLVSARSAGRTDEVERIEAALKTRGESR